MPELRTVVLRHADQKAANLEVHTDVESKKVEELKLNPNVGIHIWFPTNKLHKTIKENIAKPAIRAKAFSILRRLLSNLLRIE